MYTVLSSSISELNNLATFKIKKLAGECSQVKRFSIFNGN